GLVRLGAPEDVLDETLLADIYGCDVRVESNSATSRPTVWVPYTTDASPRRAERQMRICSLLPSATEIVLALGLGDHLVAVTHECDLPPGARPVPVITRSTVDHGTRGSREIHTHVTAAATTRPRVFAMEWLDPPYSAGHWVPEMIRLAGGHDEMSREGVPSVEVSWAQIAASDPEIILLMPCSFSLERTLEELGRIA